jgi:hypothetical protein
MQTLVKSEVPCPEDGDLDKAIQTGITLRSTEPVTYLLFVKSQI